MEVDPPAAEAERPPSELSYVEDGSKEEEIAQLKRQLADQTSRRAEIELQHEEALHEAQLRQNELEETLESVRSSAAHQQSSLEQLTLENQSLKAAQATLQKKLDSDPNVDRGSLEELEGEKTELLKLVDRLQTDKKELQASLDALEVTYASASTSIRRLESSVSTSTDAERQARLKLQATETELSIVVKDRDWYKAELALVEASFKSFRQEKQAQLVQLQSTLDSTQRDAESSNAALASIRAAHASVEKRLLESLTETSELKAQLIQSETSFKADADAQKRLIALLQKRDAESQRRIAQIDERFEEVRSENEAREQELQATLDKERSRNETLDAKLQETRELVEKQASGMIFGPASPGISQDIDASMLPPHGASTPARHTPSFNFDLTLSPAASLASKIQKSGRSYTEIYSDYVRIQSELAAANAENSRLTDCLNSVLADLEDRAPLLREQRAEYERSQAEIALLSAQLAETSEQRDLAQRQTAGFKADLEAAKGENKAISGQLRDLGRQCRAMVRQLAAAENPLIAERSEEDDDDYEEEMQRLSAINDTTDTDAVIDAQLVTFRSISELQANNQKLLRIVRDLGRRMEEQDDALKSRIQHTENEAISEAHQAIVTLKEELQASKAAFDAASRERDMFRRMATQQSPAASRANGAAEGANNDDSETRRLLADTTSQFETYKSEMSEDMRRLRSELDSAYTDGRQHQVAAAKAASQVELLGERIRLMSEEDQRKSREASEHNKIIGRLQSQLAKQEDAIHQLNEKLIGICSERDRLLNDTRNLRAEREAWKSTEARLSAENQGLNQERSSLNDLLRNLQSMQNEVERAGQESRRKLEQFNATLSQQLEDTKNRLSQESESHRQLVVRREVEAREASEKIERLTSDLSTTKEALAVANTAQQHLEQRVADLSASVASKEEKLSVYEGRSTSTTGTDINLSREQQLEIELAELRGALRKAQLEATQAKAHVEQYQAISQSNEDALASLTATSEEYKTRTEASIAAKEAEITSLHDKLEALAGDLATASSETSSLHEELSKQRAEYEARLKEIEASTSSITEREAAARADQQAARAEFAAQVALAREADDKYNRELLAHAEDVKALTVAREELGQLRTQLSEASNRASTAVANLQASTVSWENQRSTLQKELEDLKRRHDDLRAQNGILHQHLESITAQATQIQTHTESLSNVSSTGDEGINQVVKYLRDQQEILELQLQLEKQEKSRLQAKLEHVEKSLDESRAQLSEERQALSTLATQTAQHDELLAKINELEILRESNGTLRAESSSHARRAASYAEQIRNLESQLGPLQEQTASLQAEIEAKEDQINLLREDNARWKQRNEQVLAKYDRIDPAEYQALKSENAALKEEKENAAKEREAALESLLQQKNAEIEHQKALSAETLSNAEALRDDWRARFQKIQSMAKDQRVKLNTLEPELATAKQQAQDLQSEIVQLKSQLSDASSKAASAASSSDAHAQVQTQWDNEKLKLEQLLQESKTELETQKAALQEEITKLQSSVAEATKKLEAQTAETAQLSAKLESQTAPAPTADPDLVQAEVERRLASMAVPVASAEGESEEDAKKRQEELQATIAKERERAIEELTAKLQSEKEAALAEERAAQAKALAEAQSNNTTAIEQALTEAKATHEAAIQQFQTQIAALTTQLEESTAKQTELQTKLSEASSTAAPAGPSTAEVQKQIEEALTKQRADIEDQYKQTLQSKENEATAKIAAAIKESEQKILVSKSVTARVQKKLEDQNKVYREQIETLKKDLEEARAHTATNGNKQESAAPESPGTSADAPPVLSIKGAGATKGPAPIPPIKGKASAGKGRGRGGARSLLSGAMEGIASGKRPREEGDGQEGGAKRAKGL